MSPQHLQVSVIGVLLKWAPRLDEYTNRQNFWTGVGSGGHRGGLSQQRIGFIALFPNFLFFVRVDVFLCMRDGAAPKGYIPPVENPHHYAARLFFRAPTETGRRPEGPSVRREQSPGLATSPSYVRGLVVSVLSSRSRDRRNPAGAGRL